MKTIRILVLLVLCPGLLSCNGLLEGNDRFKLGVPYRAQTAFNYCIPASVLMWRLYDGLPEVSQGDIFASMGGPPCTLVDVPAALAQWTSTYDAYADALIPSSQDAKDQMIARQITSIDRGVPVIVIVGPARNHAGIINGGHYTDNGTYYTWEFLYFHDPAGTEDRYFTASEWLDFFCGAGFSHCGQAISSGAISGWNTHYFAFKDSVQIAGGGGCRPGNCGPVEY